MDCLFCKIINGAIPSFKIYEDELVIAFLDIHPDSVGHSLIIPKKHYENISDIDELTLNHLMSVAKILKKKLEDKLQCDGLTLIQNNGYVQEIKHFHLHLKPFYLNKKDKTVEEVFNILK
ncbi:MAG: HIT domain-containing protein [Bacilli bacterium]